MIPKRINNMLDRMPRMRECPLVNMQQEFGQCEGRLERHHVWIYAGRDIQEAWAILSPCQKHHAMVKTDRRVKEELEIRSLELAMSYELARYPKKDWEQIRTYLGVALEELPLMPPNISPF